MSDITIEGKNLHDIDQTNFQSVGPYTGENEVIEPWQGRNIVNGEEQDDRFELGTFTENKRDFWEFNTINPVTRTSQFTDKKIQIVQTTIADDGMVLPKEQKWSVDNYIFTQRDGKNYPLYFYYDKNLHQEEYQATTEGEVNLKFELRESGRSVEDYQMDNFLQRTPFRPFLLSSILSGSLLRKDRWQESVIEGEGFYDKGASARIQCFPSEFSHFVNWTDPITGEVLDGEPVYEFTMPLNDVEVVANLMHNTVIKVTPRIEGAPTDGVEVDFRINYQTGENSPNINLISFTAGEGETLSARPGHRLIIAVRPIIGGIGFKEFKFLRGSGIEEVGDPYHDYFSSANPTGNPSDTYNNSNIKYFDVAPTQLYEDDGLDELQIFADFVEAFFLILNQNYSFVRNIKNVVIKGLGEVRVNGVNQSATPIPLNNGNGLTLEATPDVGFEAKTLDGVQLFYTRFPNEDYENGNMFGPAADGDNDILNARKQFLLENETTGSITHNFEQLGVFVDIEPQANVEIQTLPNAGQIIREADNQFEYNMYAAMSQLSFSVRSQGGAGEPLLQIKTWAKNNNYDGGILSFEYWQDHGIGTVTNSNVMTVTFNVPTVDEINNPNGLNERQSKFYRFIFDAEITQESITGDEDEDGDEDPGGGSGDVPEP